jgi:hypothetical protein
MRAGAEALRGTRFLTILLCVAGIVFLWNIDRREFAVEITALGGPAAWDLSQIVKQFVRGDVEQGGGQHAHR